WQGEAAAWATSDSAEETARRSRQRPARPAPGKIEPENRGGSCPSFSRYSTYKNSLEFSNTRQIAARDSEAAANFANSSALGGRLRTISNARVIRARGSGPASVATRSARWADSSLTRSPFNIESACKAVVVTLRRSQDSLNTGASKASIMG